jgi:hypothetical protein
MLEGATDDDGCIDQRASPRVADTVIAEPAKALASA